MPRRGIQSARALLSSKPFASAHVIRCATWLYVLGMSQLQMGDNDEAIETFQKSLLLAPRKLISWAGLTGALFAAGRDGEAKMPWSSGARSP